jgi:hypothetical protein
MARFFVPAASAIIVILTAGCGPSQLPHALSSHTPPTTTPPITIPPTTTTTEPLGTIPNLVGESLWSAVNQIGSQDDTCSDLGLYDTLGDDLAVAYQQPDVMVDDIANVGAFGVPDAGPVYMPEDQAESITITSEAAAPAWGDAAESPPSTYYCSGDLPPPGLTDGYEIWIGFCLSSGDCTPPAVDGATYSETSQ